MEATPAIILTRHELKQLVQDTANQAAAHAVSTLKADLKRDPTDQIAERLRAYIMDSGTLSNPREHWANGHHIRRIETNANGKPKSMGWFMQFKGKSGLGKCISRSSARHGRLQEWTFQDIALCWQSYYGLNGKTVGQ